MVRLFSFTAASPMTGRGVIRRDHKLEIVYGYFTRDSAIDALESHDASVRQGTQSAPCFAVVTEFPGKCTAANQLPRELSFDDRAAHIEVSGGRTRYLSLLRGGTRSEHQRLGLSDLRQGLHL